MTRTLATAGLGFADAFVFSSPAGDAGAWAGFRAASSPISSRNRVPPFGQRHLAQLVGRRAGEGAFDVAEEFAFQQLAGQAGTTDGDEGIFLLRRCWRATARATHVLPVPLSPSNRIVAGVAAALNARFDRPSASPARGRVRSIVQGIGRKPGFQLGHAAAQLAGLDNPPQRPAGFVRA